MKRISFILFIAVSALGRPAFAAAPHIAGNYAFMSWSQCEASVQAPIQSVVVSATLGTVVTGATTETVLAPGGGTETAVAGVTTNSGVTSMTTNSGVGPITVTQPGLMSIGIGYIDFTPGANEESSGTAKGSISNAGGGTVDVNGNSPSWQATSGSLNGNYSVNLAAGTLTLAGTTFTVTYGNVDLIGVIHTMYLLNEGTQGDNTNCLQAIVATHQ